MSLSRSHRRSARSCRWTEIAPRAPKGLTAAGGFTEARPLTTAGASRISGGLATPGASRNPRAERAQHRPELLPAALERVGDLRQGDVRRERHVGDDVASAERTRQPALEIGQMLLTVPAIKPGL